MTKIWLAVAPTCTLLLATPLIALTGCASPDDDTPTEGSARPVASLRGSPTTSLSRRRMSVEPVPGQLLVTVRATVPERDHEALFRGQVMSVRRRLAFESKPESLLNRTYLVDLLPGRDLDDALSEILADPAVETAQPNYLHYPNDPNDTYFPLQWSHRNSGDIALFLGVSGLRTPDPHVAGADMGTLTAYALLTARGLTPTVVTVGVIDTGVDYTHPDLASHVLAGYDFADNDANPMDADGHGTHVSGVIAAVQNNNLGVFGTAANARILPLRFIGATGGTTADAILAINYGVSHGALVLNNSWGGGPYEPTLYAAIAAARDAGVLFVVAAGNDGADNDASPAYPGSYDLDNIISVAASTAWKDLAEYSNFGLSVDLAAPGSEIVSTVMPSHVGLPGSGYEISEWDATNSTYAPWSGTSMAAPAVSAAAALLYGLGPALWPSWTTMTAVDRMHAVRARILERSQRWASLGGLVATEGHLSLANLFEDDTTPPASLGSSCSAYVVGPTYVSLRCTASGDDGMTGRANYYDVRAQEGGSFDFDTAPRALSIWTPRTAGELDTLTLDSLKPATLYSIGIKVVDNAGNASAVSDVLSITTAASIVTQLFADNVEAGVNGWTTSGTAWTQTTGQSHSATHSWTDSAGGNYARNRTYRLISPAIDTGARYPTISYWQRYDLEDGYDFGYLEIRWYNGTTWGAWNAVDVITGTNTTWSRRTLPLSSGGTRLQLRYSVITDASGNQDGWYVDDVVVTGVGYSSDTLVFSDAFVGAQNWTLSGLWGIEAATLSDSPGQNYTMNGRASATLTSPLDLSQAVATELELDIPSLDLEGGYDFLYLEYSLDGVDWRALSVYTGTDTNIHERLSADVLAGHPAVYLRFRTLTDYTVVQAGAQIDNLKVWIKLRDECPSDPLKTAPGICGCGVSDVDTDSDGTPDCHDTCPADSNKTAPGICGCGVSDVDTDSDGTPDCHDTCPADSNKTAPGICGCGVSDVDTDSDGTPDCHDTCPADSNKTAPGICGCGVSDVDTDSDGTPDCHDTCPADSNKTAPGICGCGVSDVDTDSDGTPDCHDTCPADSNKTAPGICGCGVSDVDTDSDGTPDCHDTCPADSNKTAPGICGCGVSDVDTDSDGTPDCHDTCPADSNKTAPGICGCGVSDVDTDSDGTPDCHDTCPADSNKTAPGICGCGRVDADANSNGICDADEHQDGGPVEADGAPIHEDGGPVETDGAPVHEDGGPAATDSAPPHDDGGPTATDGATDPGAGDSEGPITPGDVSTGDQDVGPIPPADQKPGGVPSGCSCAAPGGGDTMIALFAICLGLVGRHRLRRRDRNGH